jgi:phosphohistidine phosphatase
MEIYVLRHGIAENTAPSGRDADRRLTSEGKRKLRQVLDLARQAGVRPDLVLTSPYVRAVETAAIAREVLGANGEPLRTDALLPPAEPHGVWEEIRVHREAKSLLLAGHEPQLSQLVGYLLDAPSLSLDMKKGALVRLDIDGFGARPKGVLRWMLVPKLASASD